LDWDFGYLGVFVYAESPDDAVRRAKALVDVREADPTDFNQSSFRILPYERVGSDDGIRIETYAEEGAPKLAVELGLGLRLYACETGTDEGDFESQWEGAD
jgi:hypothetical protein